MSTTINPVSYYSTADLSLATTLSLFFPIEVVDKTIPKKAQFMFKRQKELDLIIESYWRKELKVEPQTFFNQLKIIKSRLYATE